MNRNSPLGKPSRKVRGTHRGLTFAAVDLLKPGRLYHDVLAQYLGVIATGFRLSPE